MASLPPEVIAADQGMSRALSARRQARTARPELPPMTDQELADFRAETARYEQRQLEREERLINAIGMLRSWAHAHDKRDDVIRAALAAGVSARRIQRITGVARTTIARIASERS
jgi:hypothetical protein